MDDLTLKKAVYERCCELANEKVSAIKEAMEAAQSAAASEEKSTAGDKYDTARAMSHITRDMYAQQLDEALKLKKVLSQIHPERKTKEVQSGSLVVTSNMTYYISISLGVIEIDKRKIGVISPLSPLGQQLLGAKQGNEVIFNSSTLLIERVC